MDGLKDGYAVKLTCFNKISRQVSFTVLLTLCFRLKYYWIMYFNPALKFLPRTL